MDELDNEIQISDIFKEGGCLQDILPYYDHRDSQQKMAEFVEKVCINADNALVEAGTGTGKTLAYLIPLIKHALDTGRKAAVSTETKALQMQLLNKDLPIVKKLLKNLYGYDIRASLCLGSSNYPCYARFEEAVNKGSFLFESAEEIEEVKEYFDSGKIFSYYDIDVSRSLWSEISRDSDFCNMKTCKYSSNCVYKKVRREWNSANILIMNHYLFFSHLKTGKTYLPHFDMIVFDEAHSLAEISASQMGFIINKKFTGDIINSFRHGKNRTLLDLIGDRTIEENCKTLYTEFIKEASSFFKALSKKSGSGRTFRLKNGIPEGKKLLETMENFWKLYDKSDKYFSESEELSAHYESSKAKLFSMYQNLNMAVYGYEENWVYWIDNSGKSAELRGQPIDSAEIFRNDVYEYYESVLFVSATLSVNNNFKYIIIKLGLYEPETLLLESPFDYTNNCTLLLPDILVDPASSEYISYTANRCIDLINHTNGKTLILFTSYKMLSEVQEIVEREVDNPVFSQSDTAASKAVDLFKESENAVLMGTHSLWQGVDLQGDILKNVIITKLPFLVPDRPDVQAKIEKINERGGNPFFEYQVPEAIIKFKQGFGRLIRSGTDTGIVAIIDPRVINKNYGKFFLNSLPKCRVEKTIS